jgi:polar amino acid transport system substrate-binding protein
MTGRVHCLAVLALPACLAIALSGCASISDQALRSSLSALATKPVSNPTSVSAAPVKCSDPTASLRPSGPLPAPAQMPTGSFMRAIQLRGRLIAGVNQNYLRFGYLNPFNGQIEGLEIDILHEVARAIFGNPNAIEFKALTVNERLTSVQSGKVDIVADAVTITCDRLSQASFSTVYYHAGQRVLVPSNSSAKRIQDLARKRVCVSAGSTSFTNLTKYSGVIPVGVQQGTDCVVALQEGTVAAISGDDAILLGYHAQDPYTKLVGPRFSEEPYGMAINRAHPEFVRFVNAVLDRMRADGTLASIYRRWLSGVESPIPPVPSAHYRD